MNIIANKNYGIPWGIKEYFSFLLGLTSTMPIVGLNIGSHDISFFSILFVLAVIYTGMLSCKDGIEFGFASKKMLLWLFIGLISCLCGGLFLENSAPLWSSAALSNIPRVITLFIFCLFWSSQKYNGQMNEAVVYGFLGGCFLNCLWAVIDAGGFYLIGKSISNITFSGYISRNSIRYDSISLVYSYKGGGGFIRSSGFNYDPAHIGFLAPILVGVGMKIKNVLYITVAICAILASASTTAFVSSVFIFLLSVHFSRPKIRIEIWKVIVSFFVIVMIGLVFLYFSDVVTTFISSSSERFYDRAHSVYLSNDVNEHDARTLYLLCFPYAIFEVIPFILFGTGFGTSSLGYARSANAINILGNRVLSAYDMENGYIAYLLDTGVIGFFVYVSMLIFICKWYYVRKNESRVNVIVYYTILASAVSFAFYHYILFAPEMLMIIVALSIIDKEKYHV